MTNDSKNNEEKQLREKGLAFFGSITASVSHELNNVISIIDQTAGLLQDLLVGAEEGRPIPNERLKKIAESVAAQTDRGVRIIKRLNTFAHSVDDPQKEFEINPTIENLVALARRFAALKRAELEADLPEPSAKIVNSPFGVQQVVFVCLRWLLDGSKSGDSIRVVAKSSADNVLISIDGPAAGREQPPQLEYLRLLSERIGGNMSFAKDSERHRFELTLPPGL